MVDYAKPLPVPDTDTEAFWEGCHAHELRGQRCTACGSFRWPPIMDGVMKLSPIEFAALFDGLDWTRFQTAKGILKPSVAA